MSEIDVGRHAPNLAALVGSSVATALLSSAGSLANLASMVPSDIAKLGATLVPDSSTQPQPFLGLSPVIQQIFSCETPPQVTRQKAIRTLSNKVRHAIAADVSGEHPDGGLGQRLLTDVQSALESAAAPQFVARTLPAARPIPKTYEELQRKRGGHKYQKEKQKHAAAIAAENALNVRQIGVSVEETTAAALLSNPVQVRIAAMSEASRAPRLGDKRNRHGGAATGNSDAPLGGREYDDLLHLCL